MGGGNPDYTVTQDRLTRAATTGVSVMTHSDDISSGRVARQVHPKLDPKRKNRAGLVIRESRDNDEHPASTPVAVIFDTTGSMGHLPEQLVQNLGSLMRLLVEAQYITDPQVLFGAINDAGSHSDIPLEVGQFESSNEMDNVVTNIFHSQSGGGGNYHESYELAMYFLARKTELDSVIKRNKKGYLFIIGDELPYRDVARDEVEYFIGDRLEANIPTRDILDELQQKFEVFWIRPTTSYINNPQISDGLTELFGERILRLNNPQDVCVLIAATIAINEGRDPRQVHADLQSVGSASAAAQSVAAVASAIPGRNITLGAL